MFVLTEDGALVEGVPLTKEEVSIAGEIKDILQHDISEYISERSRAKCVGVLLGKFSFSLRHIQTTAAQPPQDALIEPPEHVEMAENNPHEAI